MVIQVSFVPPGQEKLLANIFTMLGDEVVNNFIEEAKDPEGIYGSEINKVVRMI